MTSAPSTPRTVSWIVSGRAVAILDDTGSLGGKVMPRSPVDEVAEEVQVAQRQGVVEAVRGLERLDLGR